MKSEEIVLSFSFLLLWLPICFDICLGGDALKANQNITQDSQGNLVSSNATFELGFFSPAEKSGGKYLGIWYHALEPQTVVWVANRDHPVPDSGGVFRIAEDGNLVVEYAFRSLWSSELGASSSSNRTLQLLDSGNLVLKEDDSEATYLWESFQNPTDTFLPGMKMDATLSLTCWRDSSNPAPGNFTFKLTQKAETRSFVVQYQSQIHLALDEYDTEAASQKVFNLLNNDTWNTKTYNYSNKTLFVSKPYVYYKSRLLMNSSGEIVFLEWDEAESNWTKIWSAPENNCDLPDYCGSFSLCTRDNFIQCKCLPGFSRIHDSRSDGESESKGCVRKSGSCTNKDVMFLNLTKIKVGDPDQQIPAQTEAECQSICIDMCPESQCQAYSFNLSTNRDDNLYSCRIWTRPLPSLVVEKYARGSDLSILVKTSDIAPTAKSCEPCGTYVIPYPLSTGPNCGDPMYNKFNCDNSTGKVSFMIPGRISYPVTWIDEDSRMFAIQTDDFYSFNYSFSSQNSTDFPFKVAQYNEDAVIKISWLPAPEPPCSQRTDCISWPNSTCRATGEGGSRCLCNSNYNWNNTLMSCTQEEQPGNHSTRLELILLATLGSLAAVTCIIAFGIVWRKKNSLKHDRASTRIQESLYESERHVKGLIGLGSLEEKDIEGIEAWNLWSENKILDLMDSSLGETCNENQFFKCAVVGLLCIQDEPSNRPTMSNVLYMLDVETTTMPIPTQPTFFMNKRYSSSASSSSKPETILQFDSSYEQGR
ncbi:G-type lectin S-receptor-like serine/threonine-protein [Vigna angularis]|uniref:Receptor-like serine/threonine-protein kinase n=1 Tax=Phaseolus angularis TaxID=3914 RepID=A0A8T0JFX9_PHAAN|nr:G-type lectin S-receptor-like serine/threonine-protein [Vigna angularis]